MKQFEHALAVFEDFVFVLHDAVGRQSPVFLGEIHRAARHRHAHAEIARRLDFDVDGVLQTLREQIMMIGRGRAAREQQFGERQPRGEPQMCGFSRDQIGYSATSQGNSSLLMASGWARVSVW